MAMDGTEDLMRRHMGSVVDSNLGHYEILSDGIFEAFLRAAVWGSSDRILRELEGAA